MIVRGIRRVRRGRIELVLRPGPISTVRSSVTTRARPNMPRSVGGAPLEEHVAWTESEPPVIAEPERRAGEPAGRSPIPDEESLKTSDEHATAQLQHPQGDRRPRPALPARADHPGHRGREPRPRSASRRSTGTSARTRHDDQPRKLAEAFRAGGRTLPAQRPAEGRAATATSSSRAGRSARTTRSRSGCKRRKPRGAQLAVVETPEGPLHLVHWHLGLAERERHWQVRHLLRAPALPRVGRTCRP